MDGSQNLEKKRTHHWALRIHRTVHRGIRRTFQHPRDRVRPLECGPDGENLEGLGFTVVPFGQGFKDMSPPTKELMKLMLEGKLAHSGHPVLRWVMDNIFVRTDPAGNIKPDKEKSNERIDGAVATIMALDRAIRNGGNTRGSVYDERGLLTL